MRRSLAAIAAGLAIAFTASVSQGGNWLAAGWHNFCAATQRNNAWPEAFVPTDRAAARAPFVGNVMAGWRLQNTLSDYHFEDDTGALKESGVLKVMKIVTQSPPDFRTVFVLRAETAQLTAARIASTQEAAARYALPGNYPQVGETFVKPRGSPAYYVVDVDRSFQETTPEPRLPPRQSSTSSSSSTGAGT
jgi:hypothetical protein